MTEHQATLIRRYVFWVALGAVAAFLLTSRGEDWHTSPRLLNGLIAIFAVGLGAELSSMSVYVGTSSISIAFIPYLGAAFLFSPAYAMAVVGLTVLVVEALVRKKPLIKVVFNTSKEILAVGAGASVYALLGGEPSLSEFHYTLLGVLGAGVVYTAVNSLAVSLAVSLTEGPSLGEAWVSIYGGSILYDLFAAPIPAVLAYLYVRWELGGLVALTVPLFIVRHIYLQNLRLEQSNRELLDLMVKQVELVEPYTSGHSRRVAQYARVLAREAGVHGKQVDQIATAALLHDVGKVYEEYAPLLRKQGKLTPDERKLLESHPVRSAELVTTITSLRGPVEKAIRHHHENFDGTGYPEGLIGKEIPIGARIIMIADTLDAMTTDRPYRKALPFDSVLDEVRKHSGTQFDPDLADLVVKSPFIHRLVTAQMHVGAPGGPATQVVGERLARLRERATV